MRLFAVSRANSASPQTERLVTAAYLHFITKASWVFPALHGDASTCNIVTKSKRIYSQSTMRILNNYDLVIKQPEKFPVHSSYNTREAFVMRCRQTVTTKHTVRGFAEFARLTANGRLHWIENATVFLSLYRKFSGVSYNITYIYDLLSTLTSSSVNGRHSPFLRSSGRVRDPMAILLR